MASASSGMLPLSFYFSATHDGSDRTGINTDERLQLTGNVLIREQETNATFYFAIHVNIPNKAHCSVVNTLSLFPHQGH